jgi:hypothetical protein
MSVDTVNQALTAVRLSIAYNPDAFSPQGKEKLLFMAGSMRYYLMREDISGFDQYVDNALGSEPDAMSFLLDELFTTLGFPEGVREQLTDKLLAKD